jgi:hypothetical protein
MPDDPIIAIELDRASGNGGWLFRVWEDSELLVVGTRHTEESAWAAARSHTRGRAWSRDRGVPDV